MRFRHNMRHVSMRVDPTDHPRHRTYDRSLYILVKNVVKNNMTRFWRLENLATPYVRVFPNTTCKSLASNATNPQICLIFPFIFHLNIFTEVTLFLPFPIRTVAPNSSLLLNISSFLSYEASTLEHLEAECSWKSRKFSAINMKRVNSHQNLNDKLNRLRGILRSVGRGSSNDGEGKNVVQSKVQLRTFKCIPPSMTTQEKALKSEEFCWRFKKVCRLKRTCRSKNLGKHFLLLNSFNDNMI